jgi:ABC-type Fe3+ transport system permease subunit
MTPTTITLTLILSGLLLLSWREGVLQRYIYIERTAKLSKLWHRLGGLARACFVAAVAVLSWSIWWVLVAVVVAGLLYNIFINLYKDNRWWYIGTTAATDKLIRKIFWFINFD